MARRARIRYRAGRMYLLQPPLMAKSGDQPPPGDSPCPPELMETFAANARAARQKAGLSLRAVAAKTGMSYQHLSKLENAKVSVNLSTIETLAKLYGQTAAALLTPARNRK
jgi:ribosome-binding protein aMBF1 (putative translation factor)